MNKTWECHRLSGGFSDGLVGEDFDGQHFAFNFGEGVPVCIIGSAGFAQPQAYLENHFGEFRRVRYTVNKREIDGPQQIAQVIPELLLDFTHNTLLVKDGLRPDLIKRLFKLSEDKVVTNELFTVFRNLDKGQVLMAMLYYLDNIRLELSVGQSRIGTPLLEVFRS